MLKWAGGKSGLVPTIRRLMPPSYGRYIEPFAGGAALFFDIEPARALLNDSNTLLINAYHVVRHHLDELTARLRTFVHTPDFYYGLRAALNSGRLDPVGSAAAFVAINKWGYNGLWRVNRRGECNVPFGDQSPESLINESVLRACQQALARASLLSDDFAIAECQALPGDWIYADPPYFPMPGTASFTQYSKSGFGRAEQERLASMLRRLAAKGVHWIASNSDTPEARELYAGFDIRSVSRSNSVSCKGSARGRRMPEILVLSGTWEAPPCS